MGIGDNEDISQEGKKGYGNERLYHTGIKSPAKGDLAPEFPVFNPQQGHDYGKHRHRRKKNRPEHKGMEPDIVQHQKIYKQYQAEDGTNVQWCSDHFYHRAQR